MSNRWGPPQQALKTIHIDKGFIPENASATNTMLKVLAALKADHSSGHSSMMPTKAPVPGAENLEPTYWQLADEMLKFFRVLPTHRSYKSILERTDGAEYKACHDAVLVGDNVTIVTLPMIIRIPHLYGKLKPKAPMPIANQNVAKPVKAIGYMGSLHETGRFFWKLVSVGPSDDPKGTMYKVTDRGGNIGFFKDRVELWIGKVQLGDCFGVLATPCRHSCATDGEKYTVLRAVEFIPGTLVQGRSLGSPAASTTT